MLTSLFLNIVASDDSPMTARRESLPSHQQDQNREAGSFDDDVMHFHVPNASQLQEKYSEPVTQSRRSIPLNQQTLNRSTSQNSISENDCFSDSGKLELPNDLKGVQPDQQRENGIEQNSTTLNRCQSYVCQKKKRASTPDGKKTNNQGQHDRLSEKKEDSKQKSWWKCLGRIFIHDGPPFNFPLIGCASLHRFFIDTQL